MKILIDSREQQPYHFVPPKYEGVITETTTLQTGDYSIAGLADRIAVERKSLNDMAGTLSAGRDRFTRELERARGFSLFAIVIEATMQDVANHKYTSKMTPQSLLQSLFAFQVRYGIHVLWAGDRNGGEYATHSLLAKYLYEQRTQLEKLTQAHGNPAK